MATPQLGVAPSAATDAATKGYVDGLTPAATTAVAGVSRFATNAEMVTGTATNIGATPAGVAYAMANSVPTPFALTDAATIATDVAGRNDFRVTITASRTLGTPTNPTDGQEVKWAVTASGGPWTLTLTTGAAGSFKFGTDITSIPSIAAGTTTYIGAKYNLPAQRWHVLAVSSGF